MCWYKEDLLVASLTILLNHQSRTVAASIQSSLNTHTASTEVHSFNIFATMKLAAVALLSLSSVVLAYPGDTPQGYGTSSSTKGATTSKTTSSTCKPSTYTISTSGWSTYTTYKPVTTSVLTTYKSNYPVVTTKTDKVETTYTTTVTVPFSGPYTSVTTGVSTSNEVKDVTVTLGSKFLICHWKKQALY